MTKFFHDHGWVAALAAAAVLAAGCSDDGSSPAGATFNPDETTTDGTGSSTSGTGSSTGGDTLDSASGSGSTGMVAPLVLECGEPPMGAVGAEYAYGPMLEGADGAVTWQVEGLPTGMNFDPLTGELGGAPEVEGSFDVSFVATTATQSEEQVCTIEIGPGLGIDLSGLGRPCIGPDDDLLDYVSGGDGAPIACTTPGGSGNGSLPEGVSVDESSCVIEGSSDDTYGTWVWITRVEQSGNALFVPYCYTIEEQEPDAYTITGLHSGGTADALDPFVGTFEPGQDIGFGGDDDPHFEVLGPCGATSCFYGFAFFVGASPFGDCGQGSCFGLSPTALLSDADGAPIGFQHELWALGDPVPEGFESRPFVLSWELNYCIADNANDCDGSPNILANGDGILRFGVIMQPAG